MAVYLKKFENHTQYENYINGSDAILPNVSLCTTEGDVHYNPYVEPVETRLVAKFNVTSTTTTTKICYNQFTSGFSSIEIDGIEQPSVVSAYTFSTTGEHTVKYTLADPTSIGNYSFVNCSGLTSITIPNSVMSISNNAFDGCGLTSIIIPNSVTSIDNNAFWGCSSLTSVTIPSSVTSIGDGVFTACKNLPVVDNIRYADTYAVETVDKTLTTYIIKNNTRFIGNKVFSACTNLENIMIPDSVISIGSESFKTCTSLTSITIPNSVTSITGDAFRGCSNLTSCTIGSSVKSIGSGAFYGCSGLTSITSSAAIAPTIYVNTFRDIKTNGTLIVPSGSSGYDTWMQNANYYLGLYNWTKVEQ